MVQNYIFSFAYNVRIFCYDGVVV